MKTQKISAKKLWKNFKNFFHFVSVFLALFLKNGFPIDLFYYDWPILLKDTYGLFFFAQIFFITTCRKKTTQILVNFFFVFFKDCGRKILFYLHSNRLFLFKFWSTGLKRETDFVYCYKIFQMLQYFFTDVENVNDRQFRSFSNKTIFCQPEETMNVFKFFTQVRNIKNIFRPAFLVKQWNFENFFFG